MTERTPARRRGSTAGTAGALALTGLAAAATWLHFRRADEELEARTRQRLAPRRPKEGAADAHSPS